MLFPYFYHCVTPAIATRAALDYAEALIRYPNFNTASVSRRYPSPPGGDQVGGRWWVVGGRWVMGSG